MYTAFEWDEKKRLTNIEKHRIDFVDAASVFKMFIHTIKADSKDYGEERFMTVGLMNGIEITVIHTLRNEKIRIISARRARVQERKLYHEEALKMGTDFEALRAMKDEDIDCSDIPEITAEQWENGTGLWITPGTEYMPLAIETDMLNYFRKMGKGYAMVMSSIINDFLRNYVSRQEAGTEGTI